MIEKYKQRESNSSTTVSASLSLHMTTQFIDKTKVPIPQSSLSFNRSMAYSTITMILKSPFLVAWILMLLTLSTSNESKGKEDCTQSLAGLATCLPYVRGTAKSPTPDCCNGLKQVLKTSKKCLCQVIKDANDPAKLGLNINVTLALTLPDVCKAPANISECPALLNLPPNSPDARIFYQLGKNGSSIASSPKAGGPAPSGVPIPVSAPAGSTVSPPKSGGSGKGKSTGRLDGEILLLGIALVSALVV